jgi:carbon-monoxide dehydrogenase large subunit
MSGPQGIGAPVKRKEDRRFLLGKGNYTDDITLPDQSYAMFVRSPHAHAKIKAINADAAKASPGVLAVLTGADVADSGLGGIPCGWLVKCKDGSNMVEPPHPALVQGVARHVGDPVVMIVAETKAEARAAVALVDIEYDVLPAVGLLADAIANGASMVWPEAKGNI